MPAYEAPEQLSVEYLLSGVKQLSHPELREFVEKLTEWQAQRKTAEESELLGVIQANSQLPEKEHRRYRELWHKCEDGTLSEVERVEYQALLNQLEVRNTKRIEALILLARLRGKTLREVTTEVGTKEGSDAF